MFLHIWHYVYTTMYEVLALPSYILCGDLTTKYIYLHKYYGNVGMYKCISSSIVHMYSTYIVYQELNIYNRTKKANISFLVH